MKTIGIRKMSFIAGLALSLMAGLSTAPYPVLANSGQEDQESGSEGSGAVIEKTEEIPAEAMDDPFYGMDDSDLVLPLEDGSYLMGEGIVDVVSLEDPDRVIESYDLQNDPRAITVAEARERWYTEDAISQAEKLIEEQTREICRPDSGFVLGWPQAEEGRFSFAPDWKASDWFGRF